MFRGLAGTAIGTAAGAAAYGYLYERTHLEVTEQSLDVFGWPPPLAGLRIGVLTDLHRSSTVPHEMITRAVDAVMALAPDLIVLGGDYVTSRDTRFATPAAEALAGLRAPHGVFAVLGNHDDERDVPAALTTAGFEVLRDARTSVRMRGETIEIAGLRYWTRRPADVTRVLKRPGRVTLLAAHDPRRLTEASALSVPLVLSGHTHGGQIVLPGLGAVAAREFPVVAGHARRGKTTIFVSRGIGTVYIPVRLNCPPEVAVLTIQPAVSRGVNEQPLGRPVTRMPRPLG